MKRNRWLTALAAVGIHMSIGSVYAWSVLTRPVMETMGLSLSLATWAFSIAILFLGLSAGFLGPLVERLGPSRSGMVSAVFFSTGLLGTAAAVHCQSAFLLYLFYGAIGGIGLGTGYITPVSTLVKWFPRHRGFATGLAIMGFGFAALIAGPAMRYLVDRFGLTENFLILAAAYALVMILSASYIRPPRKGEIPMLLEEVLEEEIRKDGEKTAQAKGLTRKEAMHTWKWYVLWWIFFTNITCGIGLLAVASPMAQEIIGMSAAEAASLVGIIGIVNGAGRILWASVSDWIGRGVTYMIFFAFEVFAFYALAHVSDALLFEILVLAVISCYGGGFSCMPAYLSDLFGTRELSAIHGRVLTAWGVAGVVGPTLVSLLRERTQGYTAILLVFATFFVLNLVIATTLKLYGKRQSADVCERACV